MQIETIELTAIVPADYNPRTISDRQRRALKASLKKFGVVEPLVINRRNNRIVGGHQRVQVLLDLGEKTCPAVFVDLDEEQEKELNIRLNSNAGEFDLEKLVAEFDLKAIKSWGIPESFFNKLDFIHQKMQADLMGDPDAVSGPEDLGPARTQPGDLWLLGDHRLLCGDSANWADVARLTEDQPVQLVNTDPPYNVNVKSRSNNAIAAGLSSFAATGGKQKLTKNQRGDLAHHPGKATATTKKLRPKDRPLANDFFPEAEFESLLAKWFGKLSRALAPGRGFYLWGGYANCANYPPAMKAAGLYFSQALIWLKGHPVMARKDYLVDHEWCFYGWKAGAGHKFFGPKNAVDVWQVKKVPNQRMVHLTEKPVELAERAIEYSSLPGERVLDLFGGSGSTLIACERTGRHARLMELDPHYCDVIVARWETLTGKKAELAQAEPV